MDDLTDDVLPSYALIHCESPVSGFHKSHFVRLLRLADMMEEAAMVEGSDRQIYRLGPDVILPIVAKIKQKS